MVLKRGAVFTGVETVKERGGGEGTGLCCSTISARRTQKWMVVFGLAGSKEEPRACRDQPASHKARRRDSAEALSKELIKATSSAER